jgi:hypothetical protein
VIARRTKPVPDRRTITKFEELPNVGPAAAGDFRLLGYRHPSELVGLDPYKLFDALCKKTGVRQDPCVIDVFLACVRFMEGAPAQPWWAYTAERKRTLAIAEGASAARGRTAR